MSKMASVRWLLNKSLSSKQRSKSLTYPDENDSPLNPNIQLSEPQISPLHQKKSISNPTIPRKSLDSSIDETSMVPNPPVKVVLRIRPSTVNDKLGDPTIKKVSDDLVAIGDQEFGFDSVLDSNAKQEDVFQLIGVPLVKDALSGYNASIISYGQTGSGKSYTMWGPPSWMVEGHQCTSHDQGIVPRIFQMLFSQIEREKEINYECRCSFLEIEDDPKNGFHTDNLKEECVRNYDDVARILLKGFSSRKVGALSSNIVFTCVIEARCKEMSLNTISSSKTNRITLVDLSEFEDFMNKDACLTHLLQQSLGGNAKLSVICTVSSDITNYEDTLSTLRFGERVRSIRNKEEDMDGLTVQIRQLKEELMRAKLKTSPTESRRNVRDSVNQLTVSINRSLMLLPRFDDDIEEEEEEDLSEFREQLDKLRKSSEPAQSESPKFRNLQRESTVTFSEPTEALAESIQRGLQLIDSHKNKSSSSVAFSFDHLTLKSSPNEVIEDKCEKLRTSVLSKSMHLRKSMNLSDEFEKEREKWIEIESEWINLTDELRLDIESHRRNYERVEKELQNERKNKEELNDALERAVLGHVRFIEQFTELQEKYNVLNENHRRVMETVNEVKKAAVKAGNGKGRFYAKAFAAELSSMRIEEKRERERLRKENKGLRIQLRETAEAVQTAGELLVRLREAEEAASFAQTRLSDVEEENEKLKREMEKMKEKHKMEMVTMKQYMADSKLPECALIRRPLHFEEPIVEEKTHTSVFTEPDLDDDGDEGWRTAFGATYHDDHQYHY